MSAIEKRVDDLYQRAISNHRVIELELNRRKDERLVLAAPNEEGLVEQLSLVMAFRQMLAGDTDFDFDQWRDRFEEGFPELAIWTQNPWGNPYEERPRIAIREKKGAQLVVLFRPNRNEDEQYVFTGTGLAIRDKIETFFAYWLAMQQGGGALNAYYPLDEYLRAKPRLYVSIQIWWRTDSNSYYQSRRHMTIPDVGRDGLDFDRLRAIAGGESGLDWGNWQARAYLGRDNARGLSQMVAGGATQTDAESNLNRFLPLSGLPALSIRTTFVNPATQKNPPPPSKRPPNSFRIKPWWFTVLNSYLIAADDKAGGRGTLSGVMLSKKNRIRLDRPKPPDYDQRIAQLLRRGD